RPRRNPRGERWAWVEAPGTAPGSDRFIATATYFRSRRTGIPNIGGKFREKQCRIATPDRVGLGPGGFAVFDCARSSAALWVRIMPLGGGTTPKWLGLGQSAV